LLRLYLRLWNMDSNLLLGTLRFPCSRSASMVQ
jgi:hypothetical protein